MDRVNEAAQKSQIKKPLPLLFQFLLKIKIYFAILVFKWLETGVYYLKLK